MCVGSISTVICNRCTSSKDYAVYLGCALGKSETPNWDTLTCSIVSRTSHTIPNCDECSELSTDPNSSSSSNNYSVVSDDSNTESLAEFEYDTSAIPKSSYSLGQAAELSEDWCERVLATTSPITDALSQMMNRVIAFDKTPAVDNLKMSLALIISECDAYMHWAENEAIRAFETEKELVFALYVTGVTDDTSAFDVEEMTEQMMELFENLKESVFYDAGYNAKRFEGYLEVIGEMVTRLEAEQMGSDAATALAFLELADE